MSSRLNTSLRSIRTARHLSREALARAVGITRQGYAPIEDGRAVPSTDVALRLARALGTTIETIFQLPEDQPAAVEAEWVGAPPVHPTRVRLCRVGGRVLARPVAASAPRGLQRADGVAAPSPSGGASVRLFQDTDVRSAVVALGCDPAVSLVAEELERERGVELLWAETGSRAALEGLARGEAHVAGCHLLDEPSGTYNRPWVERLVPFPCELVGFAVWEQGLLVAPGNPLGVCGVADLVRPGLRFVNRELGSGTRALLDSLLRRAVIPGSSIVGYDTLLPGHLAVAEAVAGGLADAGVGVRAAAVAYELGFVPLGEERYDLVVPKHFLDLPGIQALLDHLRRPALRVQVESLGGYDITSMGLTA